MNEHKLKRLFPNAAQSFLRLNTSDPVGLPSADPQPAQGSALVGVDGGKEKGSGGPHRCARILFTVYAVYPCDWDNYRTKELQDALVASGALDGDEWDILEGTVRSKKVHKEEDQRTEVSITFEPSS